MDEPLLTEFEALCLEDDDDIIEHYGTKYHSGRYPYGSGENPYQHDADFIARYDGYVKEGKTETEIAKLFQTTTTKLRIQYKNAKHNIRLWNYERAKAMHDDGIGYSQIARELGMANESSVRTLLDTKILARKNVARNTAQQLKDFLDKKGMVDIGAGVEATLGITRGQLDEAAAILEGEGYHIYGGRVPQQTNPGKMTTIKVLAAPDKQHKEIFDYKNVHHIDEANIISIDNGKTYKPAFAPPASLDSKRIKVLYAEDGGVEKDGVIELRPGVDDLSMGNAHYAQVRILVDGTHYIKGMALYNPNLPKGVDVLINSNKHRGTELKGPDNEHSVLKKIKKDPDNPFGALIKEHGGQTWYGPNKDKLSVVNKAREEGDWMEWADNLPSQFLAKQPIELIDNQLRLTKEDVKSDFDEIMKCTNPTVKKKLLDKFAETCDADAVSLHAAALPRQKYQVILPLDIPENQVYAPNYKDGETVALIRFPHAGRFEIPILKVNNKLKTGQERLGKHPMDAIGISLKTAQKLSGADFDGDTVMVIPSGGKVKIAAEESLEGLKDFDHIMEYGGKPKGTFKQMTKVTTQNEMGRISNLITDMTIGGAPPEEMARAVRHSMVVIDAEKHELDYKASERDNRISELKKKWQKKDNGRYGGSATLLSRAGGELHPLKTTGFPNVNPVTGEQTWKEVDYIDPKTGKQVHKDSKEVKETYLKVEIRDPETKKFRKANPVEKAEYYKLIKAGKSTDNYRTSEIIRTRDTTQMAEAKDARDLISVYKNPVEISYADYANYMKHMANEARKASYAVDEKLYNKEAAQVYKTEVEELNRQLMLAKKNKPKERQAELMAAAEVKAKVHDNPDMTAKERGKAGQQALTKFRQMFGASRVSIEFTEKQWEAIQAGAISPTKLKEILNYADIDSVKARATPRSQTELSTVKKQKIESMIDFGYTQAQIAKALGISSTTVNKYLKERG